MDMEVFRCFPNACDVIFNQFSHLLVLLRIVLKILVMKFKQEQLKENCIAQNNKVQFSFRSYR